MGNSSSNAREYVGIGGLSEKEVAYLNKTFKFGPSALQQLQKRFHAFASGQPPAITVDDFNPLVAPKLSGSYKAKVYAYFKRSDKDVMDFFDFCRMHGMISSTSPWEEKVKLAFGLFDLDGDKLLNKNEVCEVLNAVAYPKPQRVNKEISALFEEVMKQRPPEKEEGAKLAAHPTQAPAAPKAGGEAQPPIERRGSTIKMEDGEAGGGVYQNELEIVEKKIGGGGGANKENTGGNVLSEENLKRLQKEEENKAAVAKKEKERRKNCITFSEFHAAVGRHPDLVHRAVKIVFNSPLFT